MIQVRNKPTVAIDATPFLFTTGGVGRVTKRLVQEMVKLDAPCNLRLSARSLRGKLVTPPGQLPVRRFRLPRRAEPLMKRFQLLERLVPADLYHATDHAMPLATGTPAVATLHDLLFLLRPENHIASQHSYQRETVPRFAKACRHILTCSAHSKKDIMTNFDIPDERVTVVPWGIDREMFHPPVDPKEDELRLWARFKLDTPYLLAVSCSMGRKNTGRLLDAWSSLKDKRGNCRLVLVWSPPSDAHPALNDPSVFTTGRVSDEELVRLYGNAIFTVFPSLYEGFGLPVLESMSCGTPVLCSDRTSLPEVGGQAALYVDPGSTEAIAEQLRRILDGDIHIRERRAAGFAQCANFSWQACAQATLDVYAKALNLDQSDNLPVSAPTETAPPSKELAV